MHKITKGLKKKKKGKKSKHKEEELFKPEELEAYRREHQQPLPNPEVVKSDPNAPAPSNDEWKKFNALTAGIDTFLKKTQDDLDRIKSTSFFQRVPTSSEVQREAEAAEAEAHQNQLLEEAKFEPPIVEPGIVEVSESESEEEDEDIFDTAYIDAIAAGEVKLAYIPESPTEQVDGDDPFDTSIADRAILGPASTRKGKKLVPLGAAVEVLTGRVQAPTCVPIKRPSTRRTVLKESNLLLRSFDETDQLNTNTNDSVVNNTPSLLDDDTALPLPDEPIDLSKTLHQVTTFSEVPEPQANLNRVVLAEFDVIANKESPIDDEFALLAAESITKTPAVAILPSTTNKVNTEENWNAFEDERRPVQENGIPDDFEDDPFDTTFAENVAPGKCELKIIENEILSTENDFDFDPRAEDKFREILKKRVSIQITDPSGYDYPERISESELNTLQLEHRDLLGGSITDLSNLGEQPLQPNEKVDDGYIEYCDPFDTTIVDSSTAPGQTELKFLEKELLSDLVKNEEVLSDDDFNPRAEEIQTPRSRKSSINRSVAFTLPIANNNGTDLFAELDDNKKTAKPLTPYYVRANSIPEQPLEEDNLEDVDPFDTSFVTKIGPGKSELKAIEKELFQAESNLKRSLSDPDFDPRDDKQVNVAKVVQTIQEINDPKNLNKPIDTTPQVDLLTIGNNVITKVLTPAGETTFDDISYADPFDTSIASNILPGKAELKLLETELIHTQTTLKRVLTDPEFDPRDLPSATEVPPKQIVPDLLEQTLETVATKPLTPVNFSIDDDFEDVDPFDTSIANNIGLGQTEIKLLESELI